MLEEERMVHLQLQAAVTEGAGSKLKVPTRLLVRTILNILYFDFFHCLLVFNFYLFDVFFLWLLDLDLMATVSG